MTSSVALPTEGVDRNTQAPDRVGDRYVALPTEGVDRNPGRDWTRPRSRQSPSPRRAWIEIREDVIRNAQANVALPTEGVDRNNMAL